MLDRHTGPEAGTFSLLGGPLHRIGQWLGLVRGTDTVHLGLALGVGMWLVVVGFSALQGFTDRLFTLSLVAVHARLLLVIPLFFLAESWVSPQMTGFVKTIVTRGIVPSGVTPALDAEVARTGRWVDAWWPEAMCLLAASGPWVLGSGLPNVGTTGAADTSGAATAGVMYFGVGLTLFRFLLFRWAWKLGLWTWFLWRVSRLDLMLIPGHPDRAGGLGVLEAVHERFVPLVAALSVLACASLAESIATGTLEVAAVYPQLAMTLLLDAALFLSPLLVFTDKLWAARAGGLGAYMALAARYVTAFEAKWTGGDPPARDKLLGTPDLQALADLGQAISVVGGIRWITASRRLLTLMALAAIVPLLPLLAFEYTVLELVQRFFSKLIGS